MSARLTQDELARYKRQIMLKEVGGPGQKKLKAARVLIIGAGGLGGPAGLYLAAAGVGHIGIADDDVVSLSNLHRQIQFQTNMVGESKPESLKTALHKLNPHCIYTLHNRKVSLSNGAAILDGYDLVLDGTDDFEARFAINALCLNAKTPLISGALGRFDGQLAAFKNDGKSACYRCLVPSTPPNAETCAAVGVLGALPGIIGAMMAMEAIKIITGAGEPLFGRLFLYDGLAAAARTIKLPKDPKCPSCG